MHNLTVRFKNKKETDRMVDFLQQHSHIMSQFKNDNNNISGDVDLSFSYALPGQVPDEFRTLFLNMQMQEIPPYIWKLACWMSYKSEYREGLDPIIYFDSELFKLVIHPTGMGHEIRVSADGMIVETGTNSLWKFVHRNKEHNDRVMSLLLSSWREFSKNNPL